MLLVNCCRSLNFVHGTRTAAGFRPRSSGKEKRKRKRDRFPVSQSPARSVAHSSPLCLLGGAASGASAESSRARTAQAASSGLQREA